tara:strand:- start:1443 stop:1715 length:273 start_codon:yes stop_codon:yes gene_type:complete
MDNKIEKQEVAMDTELKEWLVNYVGNKKAPEDGDVTVEMIIEAVAEEFPEFLLVVAEENFLRGYEQGLADLYAKAKDEHGKNESSQIHKD